MDVASIMTIASAVGTGVGGFIGGRMSGRTSASQIATDTVELLQAQIEAFKEDKERRELEILDLTQRVAVLEGLVTQRAPVEELTNRVTMVKEVVDRVAMKVGA
jgi:FtsZ-binding cell division protein ZapB